MHVAVISILAHSGPISHQHVTDAALWTLGFVGIAVIVAIIERIRGTR